MQGNFTLQTNSVSSIPAQRRNGRDVWRKGECTIRQLESTNFFRVLMRVEDTDIAEHPAELFLCRIEPDFELFDPLRLKTGVKENATLLPLCFRRLESLSR